MAKFFVGQRVRLIWHTSEAGPKAEPIGSEGVIFAIGDYRQGGDSINGLRLRRDYQCVVRFQSSLCHAIFAQLEPIQPSGHCAGDYNYRELMDSLKGTVNAP